MILNIRDIGLKCHFTLPKIGLPKIKTLTPPMGLLLYLKARFTVCTFLLASSSRGLVPSTDISGSLHPLQRKPNYR